MSNQPIAYRSVVSAGTAVSAGRAVSADSAQTGPLSAMAGLVVQRLALSQEVAAAKYAGRYSIEDRARERRVLQAAARTLGPTGRRRDLGLKFARDQIEASRVIQRGLHQRWYAHPEELPAVRRDLIAEVRPSLDRVTIQLMRQFKDLTDLPRLHLDLIEDVIDSQLAVTLPAPPLPRLYRHAALFALRSFCLEC
jgi:chorismate mutase